MYREGFGQRPLAGAEGPYCQTHEKEEGPQVTQLLDLLSKACSFCVVEIVLQTPSTALQLQ